MIARSREALVGDIGGTNARFAMADIDELTIDHFAAFRCREFPSLQAVIEAYLASVPHRPEMASLAIAAPIRGERMEITNLGWSFTRDEVAAATGAETLVLLNDFEALALALPHLVPHDLHQLYDGAPVENGAKLVLGPGTGLGVAGLVHGAGSWIAVPGEGGHVSFPAQDVEEIEIMRRLSAGRGRVSAERLISGPGLERVYAILRDMRGAPAGPKPVAEVTRLALAQEDSVAVDALGYFLEWLGRFSGDMALVYGASGGVYLGGGIAPRILEALEGEAFRTAFTDKGRLSHLVSTIPVNVITAADAALRGAAIALSR
ncbi:glucokinase [Chelativorans sp. AA-79]|uniref:glucokinase n=1 Tax=Chelativorans sp. AA-79 TaxID=3028735 RepID=UPI0023F7CD30|nr:glucokinase [Chelativorans sp. AA-79]WEX10733.1 glucokinase [Chelativorans sp. AA-79]